MSKYIADLHTHSTFSDGTDTPDRIINLAHKQNLQYISITDHDNIDAYNNINIHYNDLNIITGVELSTIYDGCFVHVLGYHIDVYSKTLNDYIKNLSINKTENTRINFTKLKEHENIPFKWDDVVNRFPEVSRLTGIHVVELMKNYNMSNYSDLFRTYLLPTGKEFIETEKYTPFDSVNVINSIGGISVIAHPKTVRNQELVINLIKHGLKGVEVFHPIHTQSDRNAYKSLAASNGLYISGGSDYHGTNNGASNAKLGFEGIKELNNSILNY